MTARSLRYCAHDGTELPDAFLATIVEVKDSLRASPRVLFRCYFLFSAHEPFVHSARTAGSTICPSDTRGLPESTYGRVAPRLPRIGYIYIYIL